jgi:hypothetical protein
MVLVVVMHWGGGGGGVIEGGGGGSHVRGGGVVCGMGEPWCCTPNRGAAPRTVVLHPEPWFFWHPRNRRRRRRHL